MDNTKCLDAGPNEDLECVVCCYEYSHTHRTPRLLHCGHTFCVPCLDKLANVDGVIRTISCPLCRWITCTAATQTLPQTLWVNAEIWNQVAEKEQRKRRTDRKEVPLGGLNKKPMRPTFLDSNHAVLKSAFLKMFTAHQQRLPAS
ncbi:uncharacterized protein LOC144076100 [Stigmatopora argus]